VRISQPPSPPIGISFKNLYDSCATTVASQNAISPSSNRKQVLSIPHCYRILKKVHPRRNSAHWRRKIIGQSIDLDFLARDPFHAVKPAVNHGRSNLAS
jgi:hypothetical protein